MRFSPYNPIRFFKAGAPVGRMDHVRTFAESDCVMLEVFHSPDEELPALELIDMEDGEVIADITLREYRINEGEVMGFMERSNFVPGHYAMRLGGYVSECVRVVADGDAAGTVLIQYAGRDNRQRTDLMTRIFGGIRYFSLRIPGGFKDSGWVFGVDCEQFMTQSSDPAETFSVDYTDKTLTVGSSTGVDVATAALINLILTCPIVFIDGTRYTRTESSSLDRDGGDTDKETCVYTVLLREAHCLNAEMELAVRLNLRRTPDRIRRAGQRPRRYV